MNTVSTTRLPEGAATPDSVAPRSASAIAARIDRLPSTRQLWLTVLLISLGGFFEVYDLVFTGYIAPGMAKSGLFAATTATFFGFKGIGAFIATTFAGLFVGTFFFGFLSRPLRPPQGVHRLAAVVFDRLGHHGVPDHHRRRAAVALHRRHRRRHRDRHDRRLHHRDWCRTHMRGRAIAFNQAVHVLRRADRRAAVVLSWCRPRCWASTAGAGWC